MRIKKIERLIVKYHEQIVGTLSLTPDNKQCAFEYDKAWLSNGFSISPLELPLKPGLFIAKPSPFYGNFGVFEDSLPDGYGRYLLHKALLKEGINDTQLSALDRLSLVGNGGMGALTYEPETSIGTSHEPLDFDLLQEKALEVLHEKNDDDVELLLFNSRNSGGCRPKALFSNNEGHWMVKFRHTYDPQDMGLIEFHYNELARQCGIRVPDFKLINGKYFTTRRFDISQDGERLHTVTAGGLLNIPLSNPILDYFTDNKDDHCKNFSFTIQKSDTSTWQWHLAPAYDLTLCTEGYNGEHATSVNGTGHPTIQDMITIGTKNKMNKPHCIRIIEEVRTGCGDLLRNKDWE